MPSLISRINISNDGGDCGGDGDCDGDDDDNDTNISDPLPAWRLWLRAWMHRVPGGIVRFLLVLH